MPIFGLLQPLDEPYDISSSPGVATLSREIDLKVGGLSIPDIVGNGVDDGNLNDPTRYQAKVVVGIRVGRWVAKTSGS